MSVSATKLHPIYVALDSQQYSRAIKLALPLPKSSVLGKALLAHAHFRAGQRYESLTTIRSILRSGRDGCASLGEPDDGPYFQELQNAIDYSFNAQDERRLGSDKSGSARSQSSRPAATASKKGKKGKKKPSTPRNPEVNEKSIYTSPISQKSRGWDWVDLIDHAPRLREGWEALPPPENSITDETTLATLSGTLVHLGLPLTAFQIYAWAARSDPREDILLSAFMNGLRALARSYTSSDAADKFILGQLQAIALQLARHHASRPVASKLDASIPTAWAAQVSLWQLQWLTEDPQRSSILPRLAESMARRLLTGNGYESRSPPVELYILLKKILENQKKWEQVYQVLSLISPNESSVDLSSTSDSDAGKSAQHPLDIVLTSQKIRAEKAHILERLERFDEGREMYEMLIREHPDNWTFWEGHLRCSRESNSTTSGTDFFSKTISEKRPSFGGKHPLRGPHLIVVKAISQSIGCDTGGPDAAQLLAKIIDYIEIFGPHASCAFSDVSPYIEQLVIVSNPMEVSQFLTWATKHFELNKISHVMGTNREKLCKLRSLINSIKIIHAVLRQKQDLVEKWVPSIESMLLEWQSSLSLNTSNEDEESQKETLPGDELLLLSIQQILRCNSATVEVYLTAATLLERAIEFSPVNAFLRMSAIEVYRRLNASSLALEHYQNIGIKQIQLDSCSHIILPVLESGGLHNEIIGVCNSILRFHSSASKSCGEHAGRAMKFGTMSKADEFLTFQRQSLSNSILMHYSKALAMDSASFYTTAPRNNKPNDSDSTILLGAYQGIVGRDNDAERAQRMISEIHNPYACLSIIPWVESHASLDDISVSDNRDLSITRYKIINGMSFDHKNEMIQDTVRRGCLHGLLIRASLCCDSARGPKKGKITKPGEEQTKRASSLARRIKNVNDIIKNDNWLEPGSCETLLARLSLCLCEALVEFTTGAKDIESDSLDQRDAAVAKCLNSGSAILLNEVHAVLPVCSSGAACAFLSTAIAPAFALMRMNSAMCELYGWGKRKRQTKSSADALANMAHEFYTVVCRLDSCIESELPTLEKSRKEITDSEWDILESIEHMRLLKPDDVSRTKKRIIESQCQMRSRVLPVIEEMKSYLESFCSENS